jgi:hypothetical protein
MCVAAREAAMQMHEVCGCEGGDAASAMTRAGRRGPCNDKAQGNAACAAVMGAATCVAAREAAMWTCSWCAATRCVQLRGGRRGRRNDEAPGNMAHAMTQHVQLRWGQRRARATARGVAMWPMWVGEGRRHVRLRGAQRHGACEVRSNVAHAGSGAAMWPCDWEGMATGHIWLGEVWRRGGKVNWGRGQSVKAKKVLTGH